MSKINFKARQFDLFMSDEVQKLFKLTFKGKLGYDLGRLKMKLADEAKVYFESKQAIVEKYSDEEKSKELPEGRFHLPEENHKDFMDETNEISLADIEIQMRSLTIDPNDENLPSISPDQWMFLMPFIQKVE